MTRTDRISEVASLLKMARQHEILAEKYRRDEEGYERNMDRASDFRTRAEVLLDTGRPLPPEGGEAVLIWWL